MTHKEPSPDSSTDFSKWLTGYETLPREMALYLAAARSVLLTPDFATSARAVFDACKTLTGATAGYVAMLSDDGAENEVLFLDAGGMPCTVNPELPMPIRGLRSESYRLNKAVYENDFVNSPWVSFMPSGHVVMHNVLFAPLVIDGKAAGLIGLANKDGDFTDRDAAVATGFGELAALALRNARHADLIARARKTAERYLQLSPAIMLGLDPEGKITLLNDVGGEILGMPPHQAIGRNWFDTFIPQEGREQLRDIHRANLGEDPLSQEVFESKVQATGGDMRDIIWQNSLIRSDDGQITGTLSSGHDITEQRKLETDLFERRRLDTLVTLARGVAHEVNNPIMGIMNYAELIASRCEDEKSKRFANGILREGKRVADMTKALLSFAAEPSTDHRDASIPRMIERALAVARPLMHRSGVKIELHVEESLPSVPCIQASVERAILDILLNALEALADAPHEAKLSPAIQITASLSKKGHTVSIRVRDNGPGMDLQELDHAKDPFFTTKDRTQRSGLGLASVHGVARQHHGRVRIKSERGIGTEVVLELPLFER